MWKLERVVSFLVITSIVLLIDCSVASTTTATERCVVPLKPDYLFFAPLIFSKAGTLISTDNVSEELEDITIAAGETVVLSCAPNYFRNMPSEKVIEATCVKNQTLDVKGTSKDFTSTLSCEVRAIEEIITPVTGCAADLRAIKYGFTNPILGKSFVLGEACYCTKQGRTIFAHTKLHEAHDNVDNLALNIEKKDYFHQEHPTSFYKIELLRLLRPDELNARLKVMLGTAKTPSIGNKKYISEDMLTHKQYQAVLKFGWNYAIVNDEEALQNLDLLQMDILSLQRNSIELYTGGYGVLQLRHTNGTPVDLYLSDGRFPVPKFLWTVVRSGNKAAAFAVFNNPQLTDTELARDTFCDNKCGQMPWLLNLLARNSYNRKSAGYVLCCDLHSFRKTISDMPELDGVTGLLV